MFTKSKRQKRDLNRSKETEYNQKKLTTKISIVIIKAFASSMQTKKKSHDQAIFRSTFLFLLFDVVSLGFRFSILINVKDRRFPIMKIVFIALNVYVSIYSQFTHMGLDNKHTINSKMLFFKTL